jgi:hypothetical protein
MRKVIRLTERDLTRIVKRVIMEQEDPYRQDPENNDPENNDEPREEDSDYWGKIIEPKLKANGWTLKVDPNSYNTSKCPYKCCTYMFKGNHNTGPNIFLDCGEKDTYGEWNLTVYTKNGQGLKKFGTGDDAARKAVAYALTLK